MEGLPKNTTMKTARRGTFHRVYARASRPPDHSEKAGVGLRSGAYSVRRGWVLGEPRRERSGDRVGGARAGQGGGGGARSEEHTSELQSLMRISYAVFCLKKKQSEQRQDH